ncbi:hypothetical protein [Mobiluncus mulieris]|uniref:DUF2335 domain-containing protein n=2 Tax=Mobiluncus mulieris TaxID=2052 RepID=E0QR87_9ACTO|nr:hypothetical protein [Mobiluncus mulieris]EFM46080.1 hypothetical protein HMPREF0580_1402 [Mobiluncus mulieris ATCC 35239]MCU9993435.1 transcription elongation factor GreAB [Mobiluncus mulieris]NMW64627.1 transcription elongation factor GreAB [Mobiluncus mulieris]NMW80363.1 transcription elongation factor GreAB [Mobiluncus mulieris]NMX02849.1 transcription elongation factor GreAB [Mobiluncus mulieris]
MTEVNRDDNQNPGKHPEADKRQDDAILHDSGAGSVGHFRDIAQPETIHPGRSPEAAPGEHSPRDSSAITPAEAGILEEAQESFERYGVVIGYDQSWKGLLPPPQIFAEYPPEVQERILSWYDSDTVDESRRLDAETKADVRIAYLGLFLGALLIAGIFVMAGISAFVFHSVALTALFLGIPALTIVTTFLKTTILGRKS